MRNSENCIYDHVHSLSRVGSLIQCTTLVIFMCLETLLRKTSKVWWNLTIPLQKVSEVRIAFDNS